MKTKPLNELKIGPQFRLIHPQDDVQGGKFMEDVVNSRFGYIICHDRELRVIDLKMKDGNGKDCWVYSSYVSKNRPATIFPTRQLARQDLKEYIRQKRRIKGGYIWKVIYNQKTDKILAWVKKNP